jgi:hypothetical protein
MNHRISSFIEQARHIQSRDEAQLLSDHELDHIYATETAKYGPKNTIADYRKALTKAGLTLYFVDMPMTLYREGDKITKDGKIRGCMGERDQPMQERKQTEKVQQTAVLEYAHDVSLLHGHVEEYLDRTFALCHSSHMEECAVGLLMATGRRNEEIGRTARMTPLPEPYWVAYSGQLKTRSEERAQESIAIPVLVPSELVCNRLQHVQTAIRCDLLELQDEGDVLDVATFDNRIGRELRRAVHTQLASMFPHAKSLSPRTLRNFYVAIALEAITPEGTPLCTGDTDHFIGQKLGQQSNDFRARDHYKKQLLPRLRYNYVLPS